MDDSRSKDPLIHGPSGPRQSTTATVESQRPFDLWTSNPLLDFKTLMRQPSRFFESFVGARKPGAWLWFKALMGLFLVHALLHFTASATMFNADTFTPVMLQMQRSMGNGGAFNIQHFQTNFRDTALFFANFGSFVLPLIGIAGAFVMAFSSYLVLPYLGVSRDRFSLAQLTLMFCYCQWGRVLEIVPILGWLASVLFVSLMPLMALKWLFRISFMRAVVAAHWFMWVLTLAFVIGLVSIVMGLVSTT